MKEINLEKLIFYPLSQQKLINKLLFVGYHNIDFLLDEVFDNRQIDQIEEGIEAGIDVTKYAYSKYSQYQMAAIKRCLMKKYNIDFLLDEVFDNRQIDQIEEGIEAGIDVTKYAYSKYSSEQMNVIKENLIKGYDVSNITNPNYTAGYMRLLCENVNLEGKVGGAFSQTEAPLWLVDAVIEDTKHGLDVKTYTNECFNFYQVEQIRLGLKKGLDVSKYANNKFDSNQMEQIRLGLEKGLDVSKYANPKYSYKKMKIIIALLENPKFKQRIDDLISIFIDKEITVDGFNFNKILENLLDSEYGNSLVLYFLDCDLKKGIDFEILFDAIRKGLDETIIEKVDYSPIAVIELIKLDQNGIDCRAILSSIESINFKGYNNSKLILERLKEIRKNFEATTEEATKITKELTHRGLNEISISRFKKMANFNHLPSYISYGFYTNLVKKINYYLASKEENSIELTKNEGHGVLYKRPNK